MPDALRIPQQIWRGTSNYNARPPRAVVSCIVLHADESDSVAGSIAWIQNPASKVSYHAIVGRTGIVYGLVAPQHRAWHAGKAEFGGVQDVNGISVGVCLSNKMSREEEYTPAALEAAAWYCAQMMRAFPAITLARITTHEAVARPAGRKRDPGPRFPFRAFVERVAEIHAGPPALYVASRVPDHDRE